MFDESSRKGRGASTDRPEPRDDGSMIDHSIRLVRRAEDWERLAANCRSQRAVCSDDHRALWAVALLADTAADDLRREAGRDLFGYYFSNNE